MDVCCGITTYSFVGVTDVSKESVASIVRVSHVTDTAGIGLCTLRSGWPEDS
jgi:hypothetical protein